MTDLRAILGDKYDETIEKASRAYIMSSEDGADFWPMWVEFADSDRPDGDEGEVYTREIVADTRRDMATALAAVLPDLLAEANTRADDAEAKARRFANLLGNNAKALNDELPREVLRQKAAAWDEGYTRGFYDRERLSPDMPGRDASEGATPNPYRRGTEGDPT